MDQASVYSSNSQTPQTATKKGVVKGTTQGRNIKVVLPGTVGGSSNLHIKQTKISIIGGQETES
jgi:hypothetical protein